MKQPKGFFTYFHHAEVIDQLTDAQAGRVYKALMRYGLTGELPDFEDDGMCQVAFTMLRVEIDYNAEMYRKKCEKNQEIAREREKKKRAEKETALSD